MHKIWYEMRESIVINPQIVFQTNSKEQTEMKKPKGGLRKK
jgi:hypothetical protein